MYMYKQSKVLKYYSTFVSWKRKTLHKIFLFIPTNTFYARAGVQAVHGLDLSFRIIKTVQTHVVH